MAPGDGTSIASLAPLATVKMAESGGPSDLTEAAGYISRYSLTAGGYISRYSLTEAESGEQGSIRQPAGVGR